MNYKPCFIEIVSSLHEAKELWRDEGAARGSRACGCRPLA